MQSTTAACKFLVCLTREISTTEMQSVSSRLTFPTIEIFKPVLFLSTISLEDRVALACTYLSDEDLVEYLKSQLSLCMVNGSYEGLIITGLGNSASLQLLQRCIDTRQDIQTVALLVCRSIDSTATEPSSFFSSEITWLYEYRQLLNRW